MYETIKEEKTVVGGSDIAKVEETVLFAREVVDSSASRIFGSFVSLLIVVISRITLY